MDALIAPNYMIKGFRRFGKGQIQIFLVWKMGSWFPAHSMQPPSYGTVNMYISINGFY